MGAVPLPPSASAARFSFFRRHCLVRCGHYFVRSVIISSVVIICSAVILHLRCAQAMEALSSLEFEGVLHPVFEEDELKLILVGGALGAAVGVFQLLVLFT